MFAHGFDVSGDVGALNNVASPRGTLEVTGINASEVERLLLRGDGVMDFNSWFNSAALASHAALSTLPRTDIIILWALGGAVDDVAASLVAKQINYDANSGADGSLQFSINAMANGVVLEWMTMLTAGKITHSSAVSAPTSRDDGASTSAGAAAVLEVVDIASGTPTFVIEDSPNDSTWATLISFAAVADGAEPTAERKTVSGTVDRHLRLISTGTFSNADLAVAIRRGLAGDAVAYS